MFVFLLLFFCSLYGDLFIIDSLRAQFPSENGFVNLAVFAAGLFSLRVLVVTRRIIIANRSGANAYVVRAAKKYPGPFEKEMSHREASAILNIKLSKRGAFVVC